MEQRFFEEAVIYNANNGKDLGHHTYLGKKLSFYYNDRLNRYQTEVEIKALQPLTKKLFAELKKALNSK